MDKENFYDDTSKTLFRCKDGDIKINKMMLCRPQIFKFIFLSDIFEVPEFCVAEFTKFLDVLMGFENITVENCLHIDHYNVALQIFPIVKAYGFKDMLELCIKILKPKQMCKEVIRAFNLSIRYDCEELADAVIDCLISYGIRGVFIDNEYYLLLEPKPLLVLLKLTVRDELIFDSVVHWALEYMKNNDVEMDLRGFLKKNGILNKLSIDYLTSTESILRLYDPDPQKSLFLEKEVSDRLKKIYQSKNPTVGIWRRCWSNFYASFIEKFTLRYPVVINQPMSISIYFNTFFQDGQEPDDYFTCNLLLTTKQYRMHSHGVIGLNDNKTEVTFKVTSTENGSARCYREFAAPEYLHGHLLHEIILMYSFRSPCKIFTDKPDLPSIFMNKDEVSFTKKICF